MAARTVGRHREGTVINLGAGPGAGGFVAGLTHRDTFVDGGVGLGRKTVNCGGMTARAACGRRHIGVVLGGQPAGEAALVTRHARRNRCWNVVGVFSSRIRAVVAACTVGRCGEAAVIDLSPGPSCCALMAGFAHRDTVVDGRSGLGGQTISCCRMAGGTTCCCHHIGVISTGHPRCKSAGVASYTVSR